MKVEEIKKLSDKIINIHDLKELDNLYQNFQKIMIRNHLSLNGFYSFIQKNQDNSESKILIILK